MKTARYVFAAVILTCAVAAVARHTLRKAG